MTTITIEADDLEAVLDAFESNCDAPILNCHFSSVAYSKTTKLERDAALIMVRRAWLAALTRPGMPRRLKPSHAKGYVARQEYYVRETMNLLDGLLVTPMAWNPHWPSYRSASSHEETER